MSVENMKRISEAEAEADRIRKEASAEARRLVESGKKEAAALLEKKRSLSEKSYADAMAAAEEEAQSEYEAYLSEIRKECDMQKAMAESKKKKAVDYILGKVVG